MTRCFSSPLWLRCALALALAPLPALAQEQAPHNSSMIARLFPVPAVRGTLEFTPGETLILNGEPVRYSPDIRIVDPQNKPVTLAQLQGQTHPVKYVMDPNQKIIYTVWIQAVAPTGPSR